MLCHPDVFRLSALVATAKQNDDYASTFLKVDAVTGAIVDTQFADALANRHGVAGIPLGGKASPAVGQFIAFLKTPAAIAVMKEKGMKVD